MGSIEEYLYPLHEGIWEVSIPKDQVTEPLGAGWTISRINIPTPGTIASYRSGQYHLHETSTEYRVHLDRHDPVNHPILHLVDDAPLLLMISNTFITLIALTRWSSGISIPDQLQQQISIFRHHLISGFLLILFGIGLLFAPDTTFQGITRLIIPASVFLIGLYTVVNGLSGTPPGVKDRYGVLSGIGIIGVAVVLTGITPLFWGATILTIIAVWMLASAFILLKRIMHGKKAVPEGFISRLLIGIISLIFAISCIIAPVSVFYLFLDILGILIMIFGAAITLTGIRLHRLMHESQS